MRSDLAEDPAVISIAGKIGLDEFAVVGRLQYLWAWFDAQSRDGHAIGVTEAWVNRKVQCDGFAQAMVSAGWLIVHADGLEVPNFDRHNGDTAKTRALGTKRKQKERSKDESHASVSDESRETSRSERDKSETREEKRREEEKTTTANAVVRKPRGSRLPEGWEPSEDGRAYASARGLNPQDELDAFRDHWTAESRATASKLDWNAAWRTWCRNAVKFKRPSERNVGVTTPAAETVAQYQARMAEERAASLQGVTAPPREVLELAGKLRMQ